MRAKGSLPALNENVQDISRLTKLSKTSSADLASVIMRDCGLTSNILVMANSTYYSPKYPIKTVSSAVTFLGFEKIYSMAFGLSIFKQNVKDNYSKDLMMLYASSYFTATISKSLAQEYSYKNPEELFVAGLLYQLPRLALTHAFPDKYRQVEKLITQKNKSMNQACLLVFDVSYDKICMAVADIYRIPGEVGNVLRQSGKGSGNLHKLVREASSIANMLFGGKPGGKSEIINTEKNIKAILNCPKFSVPNFIKDTCETDANVERFFKLDKNDVEMMVNILEWGKANPAQVIAKLSIDDSLIQEEENREDAELLFGRYITEFSMARRRNEDINKALMLAQETLYNCLLDVDVFTTFLDPKSKTLKGRLYAGKKTLISAAEFLVDTSSSNSPILNSFLKKKSIRWQKSDGDLKLPQTLLIQLLPKFAMFAPLIVSKRPIGLYFISRSTDTPFSERDEIWLHQVVENVELSFAKIPH